MTLTGSGLTVATRDRREREEAHLRGKSLVRRQRWHNGQLPVALQLHRGLAVRNKTSRTTCTLLCRSTEEAGLERLRIEQLLQVVAGLGEARVIELGCRDARHDRVLRALLQHE